MPEVSRASHHSMRFISRTRQGSYRRWMVRVGLQTKRCDQRLFIYLTDAKYYRDLQERLLGSIYGLRFNLGWNPKKESVYLNSCTKNYTEYEYFVAQVYDARNKKQYKRTYSTNKYGYKRARRLAYQWRDNKRTELFGV